MKLPTLILCASLFIHQTSMAGDNNKDDGLAKDTVLGVGSVTAGLALGTATTINLVKALKAANTLKVESAEYQAVIKEIEKMVSEVINSDYQVGLRDHSLDQSLGILRTTLESNPEIKKFRENTIQKLMKITKASRVNIEELDSLLKKGLLNAAEAEFLMPKIDPLKKLDALKNVFNAGAATLKDNAQAVSAAKLGMAVNLAIISYGIKTLMSLHQNVQPVLANTDQLPALNSVARSTVSLEEQTEEQSLNTATKSTQKSN